MISRLQPSAENIRLLNFATLCSWLTASLSLAITALAKYGQDFRGYYAAARVLLIDGNPYDYRQVVPILLETTGHAGNNPYYYPPWFAWFFTPLALLPYDVARGLWMIFNLSLWALGLWQLSALLDWNPVGWQRWLTYLYATLLFAWMTWRFEQTGILLFVLLIAVISSIQHRQWNWAGLWLALLLIKPNITLLLVLAIGLWLIRRSQWQPIIVMLGILALLLIVTTTATPDWYRPIFQPDFDRGLTSTLDGPDKVVAIRINTTLLDWLNRFHLNRNISLWIYIWTVVGSLLLVAYFVIKSDSLMKITVISVLVSFVITPYALQYDFPPLTIPLFWSLVCAANTDKPKWVSAVFLVALASVLVWERPISDGYWLVIGLISFTAWSWPRAAQRLPFLDLL